MPGVETAFATGDPTIRTSVPVPPIKQPVVVRARLARPVSFQKQHYFPPDPNAADPERRNFWATMANTFGVSKVSIIKDHNRLRTDPRVTASEDLVTSAERTSLHAVSANGALQNNQLLLFESRVGPLGNHVQFESEFEPIINSEVYLIVETENLAQETIIASLRCGELWFDSVPLDGSLEILHDGAKKKSTEIKVGGFSTAGENAHIVNKDDYQNMAIAKVKILNSLSPGPIIEAVDMRSDIIALLDDAERPANERGYAQVYLYIDAHTKHTQPTAKEKVHYRGGVKDRSQAFWKGDGVANATAHGQPWIKLRAGWYDPVRSPQRLLYGSEGYRPIAGAFGEAIRWKNNARRAHQGVDIFAPLGTPLYSCVDGTVVHAVNCDNDNYTSNPLHVDVDWYHEVKYGNVVVIKLKRPHDLLAARKASYPLNRMDLYLLEPNLGEAPLPPGTLPPAHRTPPNSGRVPPHEAELENNKLLEVEHGNYWGEGDDRFVMYAHMYQVHVAPNDTVHSGQLIGTSGKSGNASHITRQNNRHLHFEIRDAQAVGGSTNNRTNPAYYINWVTPDPSHKIEDQRGKLDPDPVPTIQDAWGGNVRATDRRIAEQNQPT